MGTNPKTYALIGPTASGKSSLALQLAPQLNAEIITLDSAQIYIGMDIGTAKPTPQEQQDIPHHLIDLRHPSKTYHVAHYLQDCRAAIQHTHQRHKNALIVGGTMLYYKALIHGLNHAYPSNPNLRQHLQQQDPSTLHLQLQTLNPQRAAQLHPNDHQRLIRALEIAQQPATTTNPAPASIHIDYSIALIVPDRLQLHQHIQQRLNAMLQAGFIDEVQDLLNHPDITPETPSLRAVGYRQIISYLTGLSTKDQAIQDALTATRRLAKRQHTWLNTLPTHTRFDSQTPNLLQHLHQHYTELCPATPA